jgi:hypothetical protein
MHPDGCEAILWRQGLRRCELWVMNGRGELRVFNGDQLMHLEALTPSGYARAQELRNVTVVVVERHSGHTSYATRIAAARGG